MVTISQWETGEVKLDLNDEVFVPVYKRSPSLLDNVWPNNIAAWRGTKTGVLLEPAFGLILEPCATENDCRQRTNN